MKRTQIYLDEEQSARLAACAARTKRTRSDIIREAVDAYLAQADEAKAAKLARFREAVRFVAEHPSPDLPSGVEYVAEIRRADTARDELLERRWRG